MRAIREPDVRWIALQQLLRKRLVINALSLYAIQGLNYLSPIIVLPFLLRALKPDGYGLIVLAQSLMGYAVIVTTFGFNLTAARDVSVARDDPERLVRIFWSTIAAQLALFIIAMAVTALVVVCVPEFRGHWRIFLAVGLLPLGSIAFPQWYFQGLERLSEAAVAQGISKVTLAVAIIALVRRPDDVGVAALLMTSSQVLGGLVAIAMPGSLKPPPFRLPTQSEIMDAIKGSAHMFGSSVATTLYGHSTALALGLMSGTQAVAIYNLGTRFVAALQSMATPLTQAVYPRVAALFNSAPRAAWHLLRRTASVLIVVMGTAAAVLALYADAVVRAFAGPGYAGAATVIRITVFTAVVISSIAVPCQMMIVSVNLTRKLMVIYLGAGILNVCLLFLLVPPWGANGAGVCLLVAETVATALMARLAWSHQKTLGSEQDGASE